MKLPKNSEYDGIILAVAHDQFRKMGQDVLRGFGKAEHLLYNLKYALGLEESDLRL